MNIDGSGNSVYLDRHNVRCKVNYGLAKVRLVRNSKGNKYSYKMRCCTFKSEFVFQYINSADFAMLFTITKGEQICAKCEEIHCSLRHLFPCEFNSTVCFVFSFFFQFFNWKLKHEESAVLKEFYGFSFPSVVHFWPLYGFLYKVYNKSTNNSSS